MDTSQMAVNKRRSSVFQRRSIIPPQSEYNETVSQEKEADPPSNSNEEVQEEIFDLKEYILSLQNEREAWKKVYNERKTRRRYLVREESSVRDGVELDLSVLTEEERAFVSDRPDYDSTAEAMEKLTAVAVKVGTLNMEVNHLHERITEQLTDKIERITGELIKSSDI